ncbi:TPA: phosphate starvation-inducible protein PhoH [Klebsiella pneumoniae]|nr:phosphate starvation-inducible protein PhoH [Klebsiella pneumoniae]HBT1803265.1 phosphate starvation-inducible protein PhoH [Klebsiella pneumoniae]HBW5495667.1 phosphate starvation-inducible protein PhoH [Klebsiella pneumoniae]HBZ9506367.1 phosphate starvation-inducible protein PhoH [Klebsiella pneumoniae]HBZ9753920.1 phosphate starvation-inducible protein PhoH [Klebsiella pneumoniae]
MGTSRKHARKVARKAVKENRAFRGRRVDYVIVDELTDAQTPRPKRDNTPVEARNEAQAHYLISIENKPLTFATGEAGCGKTFLATAVAAQKLLDKDVRKIIVTRPVLQADEDLGFLPGDVGEKFAPYFRPVYDVLQKRLGASFLEYCLKPEIAKVEIAPFAYMRGRTFENAVVILDEAQNVTLSQMKMFLTRMGENVTVIVNGDVTQCDLPGNKESGLSDALRRFKPNAHVGLIEFEADDCVRSELCKVALNAYQ